MAFGDRREATNLGDPDAMLARFETAPHCTARVVLHPRLTFIPLGEDAFAGLRETFAVEAASRICSATDVRDAAEDTESVAERAAAYDSLMEQLATAGSQRDAAREEANACQQELRSARTQFDRMAAQRAQAGDAILAARQQLWLLEGDTGADAELRRALETARDDAAAASEDLARAVEVAAAGGEDPEVAQRAVDAARVRFEAAKARVGTTERELDVRSGGTGRAGSLLTAAAAIRAQIDALQSSLTDAAEQRGADVVAAESAMETRAREMAATERALADVIGRIEPGTEHAEPDAVAERLRRRRALLEPADDASPTLRALRRLAEGAPEPLLVLLEPASSAPDDLISALLAISTLKRVAVMTENTEVLDRARELDPALGAIRQPLQTGGPPRPTLAQSSGNRS